MRFHPVVMAEKMSNEQSKEQQVEILKDENEAVMESQPPTDQPAPLRQQNAFIYVFEDTDQAEAGPSVDVDVESQCSFKTGADEEEGAQQDKDDSQRLHCHCS